MAVGEVIPVSHFLIDTHFAYTCTFSWG